MYGVTRVTFPDTYQKEYTMIYGLVIVLLIAWALGFGVFHVAGGLIHLLLVVAVVAFVWQLISGRRASV